MRKTIEIKVLPKDLNEESTILTKIARQCGKQPSEVNNYKIVPKKNQTLDSDSPGLENIKQCSTYSLCAVISFISLVTV